MNVFYIRGDSLAQYAGRVVNSDYIVRKLEGYDDVDDEDAALCVWRGFCPGADTALCVISLFTPFLFQPTSHH